MSSHPKFDLSIVVPVYNERLGIVDFHDSLWNVLSAYTERSRQVEDSKAIKSFEIIYCDDGSTDGTDQLLQQLARKHSMVRHLKLSRNFGKEIATTAGLHAARGQAIITIDADGQHPPELIPEFVSRWRAGNKVVIGVRESNQGEGFVKHYGSRLFYSMFNRFADGTMRAGTSDFRLIDQIVQRDFVRLTERNRITRGLIDWLGYKRDYLPFAANPRVSGDATYSFQKLVKLAVDSIISHSISPLYLTAYIGFIVLPLSVILGLTMLIDLILGDPLKLDLTGGAYVMVCILFLVGVLLVSQGIIGLYLSHIHSETQNRPLYIIDEKDSTNLYEHEDKKV